MSLSADDPIVQRVIRRAYDYGHTAHGVEIIPDSNFHIIMKCMAVAMLEELQAFEGITLENLTASPLSAIPEDPEA